MTPSLCKDHFRQVSNYFSKDVALAYALEDASCVICRKIIFVEGARRYAESWQERPSNETSYLPPSPARLPSALES